MFAIIIEPTRKVILVWPWLANPQYHRPYLDSARKGESNAGFDVEGLHLVRTRLDPYLHHARRSN
jgi:hypothetical protein